MTLHLGILQTDSVLEGLQGRFGDYPEMFDAIFTAEDPDLRITTYNVQQALPQSLACDAYLITGCKLSVYDDLPWIRELADFVGAACRHLFRPSAYCTFFWRPGCASAGRLGRGCAI